MYPAFPTTQKGWFGMLMEVLLDIQSSFRALSQSYIFVFGEELGHAYSIESLERSSGQLFSARCFDSLIDFVSLYSSL